jgi:hypothetical protein
MDISEALNGVIRWMYSLVGLEGLVGILIGFVLYAVYSFVKNQLVRLAVIVIFIAVVLSLLYFVTNGQPAGIQQGNETLHHFLSTYNITINMTGATNNTIANVSGAH